MRSDDDLEKTIAELIYRMNAAREGSAAYRLAVRELEGLVSDYELAQPIMEDMGVFMKGRSAEPIHPRTEPGQILPYRAGRAVHRDLSPDVSPRFERT